MTGTHGGKRIGAGRKLGSATLLTRRKGNQLAAAEITPLDVMQENMILWRAKAARLEERLRAMSGPDNGPEATGEALKLCRLMTEARQKAQDCAVDLAPYVHPRLAAVAVRDDRGNSVYTMITDNMTAKEAAQAYADTLNGLSLPA